MKTCPTMLNVGSRVLYKKLKEKYTGFTEKSIIRVLEKSKYYYRTYPRFTNKPVPKTVKASGPGRRWQIDIVSMKGFEVRSGGSTFRYIIQIIDAHSRYIIPQSLQTKTSKEVAIALEKVMLNHGSPELIQCDNGREFQGLAMKELLKKYNIKIVHGRPYYPQAQGKCERSNRLLKQRILFACRRKREFNWVSGLQRIAYSINTSAKRVLGSLTLFQVYYRRDLVTNSPLPEKEIKKKILNAERSFRRRQLKKAHRPSTYHIGERVLLKFPFTKTRVPTKRHIILGTVLDRMAGGRYLVSFSHPASKTKTPVKQWIGVESITSTTVEREREKQTVANKQETNSGRMIRKSHRNTYYQVLSHNDKTKTLTRRKVQTGMQVLFDPRPDGNCQFSAISHQLQRYGIYCSASNLRQKSVEHLQTWRNFYENCVHGTSFKEYLSAIANNGTYGDNLTLVALMREFNMQCYVVSTRGREENALVSNDGTYDINLPLITLGHFPENEGMHYVSVLVQPEAIQDWVEQNVDLATNVSENEVMTDDGPENVDSQLAGDGPEDVDSPLAGDGPEDVGSPLAGDGPEDEDSPFAGDRPEDVGSPFAGDRPEDVDSPLAEDGAEDVDSPLSGAIAIVPPHREKDDARVEEAGDVSTGEEAGEVSAGEEAG